MELKLALEQIDVAAGEVRTTYITNAAGQEATYLAKAAQAHAYKLANYSGDVPLFVLAEAEATNSSPQAAADAIIAEEQLWHTIGAQIEKARRIAKISLKSANSADERAALCSHHTLQILALKAV